MCAPLKKLLETNGGELSSISQLGGHDLSQVKCEVGVKSEIKEHECEVNTKIKLFSPASCFILVDSV